MRLKICGLTSLADADFADRAGADFLGFILYPKSPRYLPLATFAAISRRIEGRQKVAVMVEPTLRELADAEAAGFDRFQLHFNLTKPRVEIAEWADQIGPERLWLAPKLPPDRDVPEELLPLAETWLLDTFHAEGFGGSGLTGDWEKFLRHRQGAPTRTWVLAGGLGPANIGAALRASGATVVDVNSGVEVSPGVKDHAKIRALAVAIHRARQADPS